MYIFLMLFASAECKTFSFFPSFCARARRLEFPSKQKFLKVNRQSPLS